MDSSHVFKSAWALQPGTKPKSLVFKQMQLDKTVSPEDNRARDDLTHVSCGSEASVTESVHLVDFSSAYLQMVGCTCGRLIK